MGYATLNVWISDKDPCNISVEHWTVVVTDCGGQPLSWCDIKSPFDAPCGHRDVQLPPGCYIVSAYQLSAVGGVPKPSSYTDSCIVTLSCDESACVHLLRRSAQYVLRSAAQAAAQLAEEEIIPRDKADRLHDAVNAVLEHLP